MVSLTPGYQAYQRNKYETASPHRLIVLLYEGAIRFANEANKCIAEENIEKKHIYISKFQDVVYELMASLNLKEGKEIAQNLHALYTYIIDLSIKSNASMDASYLKDAISILSELKEAWVMIGKDGRQNG